MNKYCSIEINRMSSAARESRFLLSYDGAYFEAGHSLVELLEILQQHDDLDSGIMVYVSMKGEKYTENNIREVVCKYIDPIFEKMEQKRNFLYDKELLKSSQIDKFSNIFSFLFNRYCIMVCLTLAIVLDVYFFICTPNIFAYNTKLNLYGIIELILFMLASSFFHELGHASACKYFRLEHGGIGFGLYLNFPVLYTDVTEVWKLKRSQRCIVNLAGVYFQCYILLGLLVTFFLTNNDIFRYLILFLNLGFVMTLNPFFRFDGYWMATDLLGVPNLRARSKELLKYYFNKILRRPLVENPYMLKIHSLERVGFLIYAIVMNLFMVFYFIYVIPFFVYNFIKTFPDEANELTLYLSNGLTPPFAIIHNMLTQIVFAALIVYMLFQILRPLIKRYEARHGC